MQRFVIRKNDTLRRENASMAINALDAEKDWAIEIKEYRKNRSLSQNAYLHGVVLPLICDHTGYNMEEMKDYLLGEFTGWVEYMIFSEIKRRPAKRSHELNTKEFFAFCEWIEQWAAQELGVIIPRPGEYI